jgi:ABC-type sugar transport system substrate-binding protein
MPLTRLLALSLLLLVGSILGCGSSKSDSPGGDAQERSGVVLLRYKEGSESTQQREQGFLETLEKEFPSIHVLSSDQYSGTTNEKSIAAAEQIVLKYGDRLTGIFGVCEPNADGILQALEEADLAGQVKFVGFDPNQRMVQALGEGKMDGIVLQDPVEMGRLAVRTLVDHLEGKTVEKVISTGEYVATPDNLDEPKMKKLLHPAQFSGEAKSVPNAKYRVAVIPKGTTHEFWKSVHHGAQTAADELAADGLPVEILWNGPHNEGDVAGQISIVQDFVTRGVSGICLAPNDSRALADAVREAKEKGIPTVIFDSGLDATDAQVAYVATDNYRGGQLAARRLAEALGVKK